MASTSTPTTIALVMDRAVELYYANLSPKDRKKYSLGMQPRTSLADLINTISNAQHAQSKPGGIGEKVSAVMTRVDHFSKIIDSFISATPDTTALVWGAMKVLLQVAMNKVDTADKLVSTMGDVVESFGLVEKYIDILPVPRLSQAAAVMFSNLLNVLVRIRKHYEKQGLSKMFAGMLTPFDISFGPHIEAFKNSKVVVEKEFSLAQATAQKVEFEKQQEFRDDVLQDRRHKDLRAWLVPVDCESDYRRINGMRLKGTCKWLLENGSYKEWRQSTKQCKPMWVYGKPGSGKTVLSSFMVNTMMDELSSTPAQTAAPLLLYFFCNNRSEDRRSAMSILRSMTFQLIVQKPELAEKIDEVRDKANSARADIFEQLWDVFEEAIGASKAKALVIIDALDECTDDPDQRTMLLKRLSNSDHITPFLVSRNERDIRRALGTSLTTISITEDDVRTDLNNYIQYLVEESPELSTLPPELVNDIIARIQSSARGMFVWAKLVVRDLEDVSTPAEIEASLTKSVPGELEELYNRIVQNASTRTSKQTSQPIAEFIFAWATISYAPLSLEQLQEAYQVVQGRPTLDEKRKPFSLEAFQRQIESACGPILEVNDDGLLVLVHHTTKEFLIKHQSASGITMEDIHARLARTCLDYLSLAVFNGPLLNLKRFEVADLNLLRPMHPFLEYAALHWPAHVKDSGILKPAEVVDPLSERVSSFMRSRSMPTWMEAVITINGNLDQLGMMAEYLGPLANYRSCLFDWERALRAFPSEIHYCDMGIEGELRRPERDIKMQYLKRIVQFDAEDEKLKGSSRQFGLYDMSWAYVNFCPTGTNIHVFDSISCKTYNFFTGRYLGESVISAFRTRETYGEPVSVQQSQNGKYIAVNYLYFPVSRQTEEDKLAIEEPQVALITAVFPPPDWASRYRDRRNLPFPVHAGSDSLTEHQLDSIIDVHLRQPATDQEAESPYKKIKSVGGFNYTKNLNVLGNYKGAEGFYKSTNCIAFSEDGEELFCPGGTYDMGSGEKSASVFLGVKGSSANISSKGQGVAFVREDSKTLEVRSTISKTSSTAIVPDEDVTVMAISPSGRFTIISGTKRLYLFDTVTNHLQNLAFYSGILEPKPDAASAGSSKEDDVLFKSFNCSFNCTETLVAAVVAFPDPPVQLGTVQVWEIDPASGMIHATASTCLSYTYTDIYGDNDSIHPRYAYFDPVAPKLLHISFLYRTVYSAQIEPGHFKKRKRTDNMDSLHWSMRYDPSPPTGSGEEERSFLFCLETPVGTDLFPAKIYDMSGNVVARGNFHDIQDESEAPDKRYPRFYGSQGRGSLHGAGLWRSPSKPRGNFPNFSVGNKLVTARHPSDDASARSARFTVSNKIFTIPELRAGWCVNYHYTELSPTEEFIYYYAIVVDKPYSAEDFRRKQQRYTVNALYRCADGYLMWHKETSGWGQFHPTLPYFVVPCEKELALEGPTLTKFFCLNLETGIETEFEETSHFVDGYEFSPGGKYFIVFGTRTIDASGVLDNGWSYFDENASFLRVSARVYSFPDWEKIKDVSATLPKRFNFGSSPHWNGACASCFVGFNPGDDDESPVKFYGVVDDDGILAYGTIQDDGTFQTTRIGSLPSHVSQGDYVPVCAMTVSPDGRKRLIYYLRGRGCTDPSSFFAFTLGNIS